MKDFNFFEEKGYKELQNRRQIYIIAAVIGIVIVFSSGLFIRNIIIESRLKKSIAENEDYINNADIKKKAAEYNDQVSKKKILTSYESTVDSLNKNLTAVDVAGSNIIQKITSTVPKKVSFVSMNIDSKSININGTAEDRPSIAELEHNLKALDIIDSVYVGAIVEAGEDKYTFSIKCSVKDAVNSEVH